MEGTTANHFSKNGQLSVLEILALGAGAFTFGAALGSIPLSTREGMNNVLKIQEEAQPAEIPSEQSFRITRPTQ